MDIHTFREWEGLRPGFPSQHPALLFASWCLHCRQPASSHPTTPSLDCHRWPTACKECRERVQTTSLRLSDHTLKNKWVSGKVRVKSSFCVNCVQSSNPKSKVNEAPRLIGTGGGGTCQRDAAQPCKTDSKLGKCKSKHSPAITHGR